MVSVHQLKDAELCVNGNWQSSFNQAGWSKCPPEYPYINGLTRSGADILPWPNDGINHLEQARCCKGQRNPISECKEVNWNTFDNINQWNLCPTGYYLSGLYRSGGDELHNIESAWCCKPRGISNSYKLCYEENVIPRFAAVPIGMASCRTDYYVTGLFKSVCDWLSCIHNIKCCSIPIDEAVCPIETVGTKEEYGVFTWPSIPVKHRSSLPCPYNPELNATRECRYLDNTAPTPVGWGPIDLKPCNNKRVRSKELSLLAQIEVNIDNVVNVSRRVNKHSYPGESLSSNDIGNIATVLERVVGEVKKANEVYEDVFSCIDNVLDAETVNILESEKGTSSSKRVVEALNNITETIVVGSEGKFQDVKRNFAVNVVKVQPQSFSGLTFSGIVSEDLEVPLTNDSISTTYNNNDAPGSAASIAIPGTIFNETTLTDKTGEQTVIFMLYKETKFFRALNISKNYPSKLNSFVISASIKSVKSPTNLRNSVNFTVRRLWRGDLNSTLCSYWNFDVGDWSQDGCSFEGVLSDGRIVCSCDHLTNFAMLMDIDLASPTQHDLILGKISYIGCALSLGGLILTIIAIMLIREIRNTIPSQILVNFCMALSLTLIVFLVAAERSKTSSLAGCQAAAILLHYFLLVAFLWMAVEAFNMYKMFVKVFPRLDNSKFMLKSCIFAWGTPALLVVITLAAALDKYGDQKYCRLQGIPFFVAFLTPVVVILIGNLVVFCLVIRSLFSAGSKVTSDRKVSAYQQARRGIAIMVLLGLTWIFGVLAINDAKIVFQYLFCIFNSLQGLFVFIFFCVIPDEMRKHVRRLLPTMKKPNESVNNTLSTSGE